MSIENRRFVTAAEKVDFKSPWTVEEWLCRSDVVPNKELLMVRANMEAGDSHPFHTHPTREEIIYILSGRAEQWIGKEHRILGPGEMVLIPKGEVHGTFNPFRERLVFLAILSPYISFKMARIDWWTLWAISGVATLPVPIAQTGSYAIVTLSISSASIPARPFFS